MMVRRELAFEMERCKIARDMEAGKFPMREYRVDVGGIPGTMPSDYTGDTLARYKPSERVYFSPVAVSPITSPSSEGSSSAGITTPPSERESFGESFSVLKF